MFASTQSYKYFLLHNPTKMLILGYFSTTHYANLQLDPAAREEEGCNPVAVPVPSMTVTLLCDPKPHGDLVPSQLPTGSTSAPL